MNITGTLGTLGERVLLKAGQTIKIGGFPFTLESDTWAVGKQENLYAGTVGIGVPTTFGGSVDAKIANSGITSQRFL